MKLCPRMPVWFCVIGLKQYNGNRYRSAFLKPARMILAAGDEACPPWTLSSSMAGHHMNWAHTEQNWAHAGQNWGPVFSTAGMVLGCLLNARLTRNAQYQTSTLTGDLLNQDSILAKFPRDYGAHQSSISTCWAKISRVFSETTWFSVFLFNSGHNPFR